MRYKVSVSSGSDFGEVKYFFTVETPGEAPDAPQKMHLLAYIQWWHVEYLDGMVVMALGRAP